MFTNFYFPTRDYMNYSKIKYELERRAMTVKEFCCKVGITEQGLYQMIRNQSMKVDVLERISEVLEIPIEYWFDDCMESPDKKSPAVPNADKDLDDRRIDKITLELNKLLKSLRRR